MIAMADAAPVSQPDQSAPSLTEGAYVSGRRAAMLSSLSAGTEQPPTPAAPEVPAPPPDPAPPTETPKPTPEPSPDDLAAFRKQEVHLRRQIAEERQQWQAEAAREQAKLKPRLEKLEQWEQRMASAKDDPIAYLQAGGWTEAEFEQLARTVYAHSPEGAKDPKNKAAAHQTKAQRDAEAKLAKMQERLDAFERSQQEQAEQARVQAQLDGFYANVVKAVNDESPIVRGRLAAMPDAAKERMLAIADRLYFDSGPSDDLRDVPAPAAIIKAYEQERRDELETDLRALSPAALQALLAKIAPPSGAAPQPAPTNGAAQPRPSTTLTPNAGTPTQVAKPGRKSRDDLIKEVQRIAAIAKP